MGPAPARRGGRGRALGLAVGGVATLAVAATAVSPAAASPEAPASENALVELGRRLFFDPAVGRTGMRACVDCHLPTHGFSDPEPKSLEDTRRTTRHAQKLVDNADSPSFHSDGEFKKIEDLVLSRLDISFDTSGTTGYGRPGSDGAFVVRRSSGRSGGGRGNVPSQTSSGVFPPRGLGVPRTPEGAIDAFVDPVRANDLPGVEPRVLASGRYVEAFRAAFGEPAVSSERIASAIAAYCHSIRSGVAPYDRFVAGDESALSESARRGLDLFRGAAGCAACHSIDGDRAKLTDYGFHDTGISWRTAEATSPPGSGSAQELANRADRGANTRTGNHAHLRAFKTPTLRDVAARGPYMHDGSLATLEAVVRHYLVLPRPADPNLDAAFPTYRASDRDVSDLVAFLGSLTSETRPGLARTRWAARAQTTRLRFVDADGRPLPGWRVGVEPSGDVLPGHEPGEVSTEWRSTDADGRVSLPAPSKTHVRIVLEDGLRPAGGDRVPDTCREATIVVPVRGRARFVVSSDRSGLPDVLVTTHPAAPTFPDRREPETVFRCVERSDGETVYEGPFRTDVGPATEVRLPEEAFGLERVRLFLDPETPTVLTLP